jgi:hypothetical protein
MYDYNGVGSAIIIAGHRAGVRHGARGGLFYSITATRPIRRRRLKVRQAIGPLGRRGAVRGGGGGDFGQLTWGLALLRQSPGLAPV